MAKFEIYEGLTSQNRVKKYIVTNIDADYFEVIKYAKRFFRCSEAHITFEPGYLYKGELYLEYPEKAGAKAVGVAYYVW